MKMKSMILLPMAVGFALTGCASERLQVAVVDNMGNPVSNATVSVGFSTSHVLFGGGNSSRGSSGHAMAKGEFSVLPSVSVTESIFNQVPNDTNLEFDPARNLYQGKTGRRR